MKPLVEYISEAKFNRNIELYDLNIVSESLKDPKLIELAKYLKKFASKSSFYNYSFGGLFSQFGVEWDKITESDWETITDIEKAKKNVRKVISNRSNSISSIILVEYDGEIKYLITRYVVFDLKNTKRLYDFHTKEYYDKTSPEKLSDLKQRDIVDLITDNAVTYLLDSSKMYSTQDKQIARRIAKDGIVLQGDEYYYKEAAERNIKRYKQIIAQRKAERAAQDDTLSKEVQEVLNKILELNMKIIKEPVKYADCLYDIASLVYYSYGGNISKANSGNSLLYMYSEYVDANVKNASGKNDSYWIIDAQEKTTKKLSEKLKEMKEKIAKIEAKMK